MDFRADWRTARAGETIQTPTGTNYEIPADLELERVRVWETSSSWGNTWASNEELGREISDFGFRNYPHP